jgi:hypothetical protein
MGAEFELTTGGLCVQPADSVVRVTPLAAKAPDAAVGLGPGPCKPLSTAASSHARCRGPAVSLRLRVDSRRILPSQSVHGGRRTRCVCTGSALVMGALARHAWVPSESLPSTLAELGRGAGGACVARASPSCS